jgi:hypothetical protein
MNNNFNYSGKHWSRAFSCNFFILFILLSSIPASNAQTINERFHGLSIVEFNDANRIISNNGEDLVEISEQPFIDVAEEAVHGEKIIPMENSLIIDDIENDILRLRRVSGLGCCRKLIRSVKKGYDNARKTLRKAEKDARRESGAAIHNTVRELGVAVNNTTTEGSVALKNIEAEAMRVGPHTVQFTKAVGKLLERQVSSADQMIKNANRRILEGKLADALFHVALDPLTSGEDNLFKATQESGWIRSAGAVAATAYGGPAGAAAYAAWQTYKATDGNAEMALKAGIIAGFTSEAMGSLNDARFVGDFGTVKKAVLAGAVGGLAVAMSGGKESEVLEGFILAGGMVIIQDGYKEALGHSLDARATTGDAYCATPGPECDAFKSAYYIDDNGVLRIDYSKLDPRASYVGEGYNLGETRAPYQWTQDRHPFMKTVAKLPGFNAMGMFHDNWVLSWQMSDWQNKSTIFPALVMTYYGTGAPLSTHLIDVGVDASKKAETDKKHDEQLMLEPFVTLAKVLEEAKTPVEFNLDKTNLKDIKDFHVGRSNIIEPGKYAIVRNILNDKIQRVLIIGAAANSTAKGNDEIWLSPLTISSLDFKDGAFLVQVEEEDVVLLSTADPVAGDTGNESEGYLNKGDILSFPGFETDGKEQWTLTVMGSGGARVIEKFDNNWKASLDVGQYMYILENQEAGQFPWGYYGQFKIVPGGEPDSPKADLWSSAAVPTGASLLNPDGEESFVAINGRYFLAEGELLEGNAATLNSEDASVMIILSDVPMKNASVDARKMEEGCMDCFALQVIDSREGRIFYANSGTFSRTEEFISFDVTLKDINDISSSNPVLHKLKGRFKIE